MRIGIRPIANEISVVDEKSPITKALFAAPKNTAMHRPSKKSRQTEENDMMYYLLLVAIGRYGI